jgi:tape measure domain-containing protein
MALISLIARISLEGVEKLRTQLKAVREDFHMTGDSARRSGSGVRSFISSFSDKAAAVTAIASIASGLGGLVAFNNALRFDSITRGLATVSDGYDQLEAQIFRIQDIAKLPGAGFEEVSAAVLALESVNMKAELAERTVRAFANALASVGKGKAELDGVITAITQIISKGKISAEEINQIAERVPQVRKLLLEAFGTADTEEIQRMGIEATEAVERIVSAAEKLPKVSGGFSNLLENLEDSIKRATLPLGRGLAEGFQEITPLIEELLSGSEKVGKTIGEVISSVARVGVISDVVNKIQNSLQGLLGFDLQSALVNFISGAASVIGNFPEFINSVIHNIILATEFGIQKLRYIGAEMLDIGKSLVSTFSLVLSAKFGEARAVLDNIGKNPEIDKLNPDVPSFTKVPSLLQNLDEYRNAIISGIRPSPFLPEGLVFGGAPSGNPSSVPQDLENPLEGVLRDIERNTRSAAESLELRRQTIGGEEIGRLGITSVELASTAFYGTLPAGTEYERLSRNEYRRQMSLLNGRSRTVR